MKSFVFTVLITAICSSILNCQELNQPIELDSLIFECGRTIQKKNYSDSQLNDINRKLLDIFYLSKSIDKKDFINYNLYRSITIDTLNAICKCNIVSDYIDKKFWSTELTELDSLPNYLKKKDSTYERYNISLIKEGIDIKKVDSKNVTFLVSKSNISDGLDNFWKKIKPSSVNNFNKKLADRIAFDSINVIYGTDRKISNNNGKLKFLNSRQKNLQSAYIGNATVYLPQNRKVGEISKDAYIDNVDTNSVSTIKKLKSFVGFSNQKDILLFIHGYNNSFDDATKISAQISLDIKFKGITMVYSWASLNKVQSYFTDMDNVKSSIPLFKKFILRIIKEIKPSSIHIIAHSMGNQLLTQSLYELKLENNNLDLKIKNIIMASPDVSTDHFLEMYKPEILSLSRRYTIYASKYDKALMVSEGIRDFTPRIGFINDKKLCINKVDIIDASSILFDNKKNRIYWELNHSDFHSMRSLLSDIGLIINNNSNAIDRQFITRPNNKCQYYWEIRP